MAKDELVFIDCETTGLDYDTHVPIEIAYMTMDMEEPKIVFPYDYLPEMIVVFPWNVVDPKAMEINKFYERYESTAGMSTSEFDEFYHDLEGVTLVGANVRFDARMLEKLFWDSKVTEPWHYRLLDMESYVAGFFRWPKPRSWKDTIEYLSTVMDPGRPLEYLPDHTAAGDCLSVREVYGLLQRLSVPDHYISPGQSLIWDISCHLSQGTPYS